MQERVSTGFNFKVYKKYNPYDLLVFLYFNEPVGRVKIQTTRKILSATTDIPKRLIRFMRSIIVLCRCYADCISPLSPARRTIWSVLTLLQSFLNILMKSANQHLDNLMSGFCGCYLPSATCMLECCK